MVSTRRPVENNKEEGNARRCTSAQPMRRDGASTTTTSLYLSRHGLWLDSPQAHAWNTMISSDQSKMLRAFQMLSLCELRGHRNATFTSRIPSSRR